jgi:hypothetical protein
LTVPAIGGRRFKLTDERRNSVCAAIAEGHTFAYAAVEAGLSESSLHSYRKLGRLALDRFHEGEEIDERDAFLADFVMMIAEAEHDAEKKFLGIISSAAETQWQAAAWILERRFQRHWSRGHRVEHEVAGILRVVPDFGGVPERAQILQAGERAETEEVPTADYEVVTNDEDEESNAA